MARIAHLPTSTASIVFSKMPNIVHSVSRVMNPSYQLARSKASALPSEISRNPANMTSETTNTRTISTNLFQSEGHL